VKLAARHRNGGFAEWVSHHVCSDDTGSPKKTRPRKIHREPTGVNIDKVINRAIEVIGDKQQAMTWLGTCVLALD
jgi:hypothetical protein